MQGPTGEDSTNDFPLGPYAPWDVTANHSRTLSFDTSEGNAPLLLSLRTDGMTGDGPDAMMDRCIPGTWMNVDVSPDGQQILFDMLGDIYTLPIAVILPSCLLWVRN